MIFFTLPLNDLLIFLFLIPQTSLISPSDPNYASINTSIRSLEYPSNYLLSDPLSSLHLFSDPSTFISASPRSLQYPSSSHVHNSLSLYLSVDLSFFIETSPPFLDYLSFYHPVQMPPSVFPPVGKIN